MSADEVVEQLDDAGYAAAAVRVEAMAGEPRRLLGIVAWEEDRASINEALGHAEEGTTHE